MFLADSGRLTPMTDRLKDLGKLVVDRRVRMGMKTTVALAERTSLSSRVLSDVENGRRQVGDATYAAVEDALRWHPGSVREFLASGQPPLPIPDAVSSERAAEEAARQRRFATEAERAMNDPDQLDRALIALVRTQTLLLQGDIEGVRREMSDVFLPVFWILTELSYRARLAGAVSRIEPKSGGDGHADTAGGSAPNQQPAPGPADQPGAGLSEGSGTPDLAIAADEQEQPIAGEQETDEHP